MTYTCQLAEQFDRRFRNGRQPNLLSVLHTTDLCILVGDGQDITKAHRLVVPHDPREVTIACSFSVQPSDSTLHHLFFCALVIYRPHNTLEHRVQRCSSQNVFIFHPYHRLQKVFSGPSLSVCSPSTVDIYTVSCSQKFVKVMIRESGPKTWREIHFMLSRCKGNSPTHSSQFWN